MLSIRKICTFVIMLIILLANWLHTRGHAEATSVSLQQGVLSIQLGPNV